MYSTLHLIRLRNFNPLHHEGGDHAPQDIIRLPRGFQSTPPRGWRLCSHSNPLNQCIFQSTPPRGWRLHTSLIFCRIKDFNPLHHEGGDRDRQTKAGQHEISIHSTTRVETAPVATEQKCKQFQSTPPRGWRRFSFINSYRYFDISIHSTTRVETWRRKMEISIFEHFNPLHHEGGDLVLIEVATIHSDFNPLHHEGGDPNNYQK